MGTDLSEEGTYPCRSCSDLELHSIPFERPPVCANPSDGSSAVTPYPSPSPCGRTLSVAPRILVRSPREYPRSTRLRKGFPTTPHSPRTDHSSSCNHISLPPSLLPIMLDLLSCISRWLDRPGWPYGCPLPLMNSSNSCHILRCTHSRSLCVALCFLGWQRHSVVCC